MSLVDAMRGQKVTGKWEAVPPLVRRLEGPGEGGIGREDVESFAPCLMKSTLQRCQLVFWFDKN